MIWQFKCPHRESGNKQVSPEWAPIDPPPPCLSSNNNVTPVKAFVPDTHSMGLSTRPKDVGWDCKAFHSYQFPDQSTIQPLSLALFFCGVLIPQNLWGLSPETEHQYEGPTWQLQKKWCSTIMCVAHLTSLHNWNNEPLTHDFILYTNSWRQKKNKNTTGGIPKWMPMYMHWDVADVSFSFFWFFFWICLPFPWKSHRLGVLSEPIMYSKCQYWPPK